jgi:hypothetical protein
MKQLLSTILLLASTSFAQSEPKDAQGVAIIQRSLLAMGSAVGSQQDSLSTGTLTVSLPAQKPESFVASGTYTRFARQSPVSYPFRLKVLGEDRFRREVDTPEGTHITVVRGPTGWSDSPQKRKLLSITELSGKTFEEFPLLALAHWLKSPDLDLQTVGAETVEGKQVNHISVKKRDITNTSSLFERARAEAIRCDLFTDVETNIPLRIRYYEHPGDWRISVPVDLEFSDYRSLNGVLFPFTVTRYVREQKISQIQYRSVDFNVVVGDDQFKAR